MNNLSWLGGALLSVMLATHSLAQAEFISVQGEDPITLQPYRSASEQVEHHGLGLDPVAPPMHRSICIDLPRYAHLPGDESRSFVKQITPTHLPSGSLVIRYEGFHRFAVKRLQSRYRSFWRKQVRTIARDSFINPLELGRMQGAMIEAWGDMYANGNWWDRTWEESLPPEKGGAPLRPYVHTHGRDLTILELGPLKIYNTMKAKVSRVELLSLDDQSAGRIYRSFRGKHHQPARDDARLERHVMDPEDDEAEPSADEKVGRPHLEPITRVAFNFAPELNRKLWEGVSWRFKARPSIRLSPSLNAMEVVRELSLKAELDILYGARREKVLGFQAEIEYEPQNNELELTVEVALLTW
jgi:hypothetical protein